VFVQSSVLPRYYTWQGESREDLMFVPLVVLEIQAGPKGVLTQFPRRVS